MRETNNWFNRKSKQIMKIIENQNKWNNSRIMKIIQIINSKKINWNNSNEIMNLIVLRTTKNNRK